MVNPPFSIRGATRAIGDMARPFRQLGAYREQRTVLRDDGRIDQDTPVRDLQSYLRGAALVARRANKDAAVKLYVVKLDLAG